MINTKEDFKNKYISVFKINKQELKRVKKKFGLLGYKHIWWLTVKRRTSILDDGNGDLCFITGRLAKKIKGYKKISIKEFLKENE